MVNVTYEYKHGAATDTSVIAKINTKQLLFSI